MAKLSVLEFFRENMTFREWTHIKEQRDEDEAFKIFMNDILTVISIDKFSNLRAHNNRDISLGLLKKTEIETLRNIMNESFEKNWTIRQIQDKIKKDINLKDRLIMRDGKKILTVRAIDRPRLIARTEASRLVNEGTLKNFKDAGSEKVEWLAVIDNRTDSECASLDGQIFNIKDASGMLPLHQNCRCTWLPVIK